MNILRDAEGNPYQVSRPKIKKENKVDNVVKFYGKDAAIDPNAVLEQAIGEYESLIIIGYDTEGAMDISARLNLKASDINWLIDSFKQKLVNGDDSEDDK